MLKKKSNIFFVFLLFTLVCSSIFSQKIKFKHIKVEDGLSQSWVRSIQQDSHGFIWFGTENGLNKYDGYRITNFYSDYRSNLISNAINKILEDSNGNLWIATDKGIDRFNYDTNKLQRGENWPQSAITDILELDDERFLLTTSGSGLLLFHPDSGIIKNYLPDSSDPVNLSTYNTPYCLPSYVLNCIIKDQNNIIWIGTTKGLAKFNFNTELFTTYLNDKNNPKSLSGSNISTIHEDRQGNIWIGTNNNGLNLLNIDSRNLEKPNFLRFKHDNMLENSISSGKILDLCEDQNGYLWIGTENGGLDRVNLNKSVESKMTFEHFKNNPSDVHSISSNSIYSLFEDRTGGFWIGTWADGVCYYNPKREKFTHVQQQPNNSNGLNNKFINCFLDEVDNLWIGTEKGLNLYNKKSGKYKHFIYNPNDRFSLGSNSVQVIYRDSDKNLWIGTWGGGLNLFNEKVENFTRFQHLDDDENSITSNNVSGLLEFENGELWISTMGGGINQFHKDSKTFEPVNVSGGRVVNNWVSTIYKDNFEQLWISTSSTLDRYDPLTGMFIRYVPDEKDPMSISNNNASIIFEDSNDNLWLGTRNGLNIYNREAENFDCLTIDDGLPNNQIMGLLEDASGNLWISTNRGLSKFIDGSKRPDNPKFINYTIEDGLQGNEFKSGACFLGKDSTMYFGGNNGFNKFNPENIKDDTVVPQVMFTDFFIANKNVEIGSEDSPLPEHIGSLNEITLHHKESSVFSIEFVLINYLSPLKNQYAYKLEGFDENWNYIGNQRLATYTNLDPGEYLFKVKGAIGENWNQNAASLEIIIVPPWWKTYWAYLSYVILIGLIFFTIWRFQLNRRAMKHELLLEKQHAEKLEELNRVKSRFFANITHEFRSPLTLIMGPMKQFLSGEIKGNFSKIAKMTLRNSERLYSLINEILELSKLEVGNVKLKTKKTDIILFIDNLIKAYTSLAESRKIELQLIVDDSIKKSDSLDLYLDQNKFEKVITNLLSNSIKFTSINGHIRVGIKLLDTNPKMIEISIKDDGVGIKEEDQYKIFDRFYQAVNPYSGDYESTGIGLALTKELVELHNGTIHVESVYNEGACFYINVPLGADHLEFSEIDTEESKINFVSNENQLNDIIHSEEPIRKENIASLSDEHIRNILVIDDNYDLREYISASLQTEYKTITAKDGEEGLMKAINLVPDLIISDVTMPKLTGIELCNKIKQNELTSHIPVVLLTVRASKDEKIEGLNTGADDYITKPFEIKELKARIKNLITQRERLKNKYNLQTKKEPVKQVTKSSDERFLKRAITLIEDKLADSNFGVEELAKTMGLSRVQIYRKIRAITGQTAVEFIRTIRLERAAELLKNKHDNIGQIAYKVGFNNPSYFSNAFYKHFGEYPTEYVKKYKK